jgi:hypothetical protein
MQTVPSSGRRNHLNKMHKPSRQSRHLSVDGVYRQDALLFVIGIPASLAAINGVSHQQIGDEALNGVLHGRQQMSGRSAGPGWSLGPCEKFLTGDAI